MPASIVVSASAWASVRGKPSRMKPLRAVRLVDALGDDRDDDLVGDQLAGVHDGLGALADLGAGRDRGAQHVAGRELRNAVLLDQTLGLGALARPRRPEQDQPHRPLFPPRSFDFLIRPSYWWASR